MRIVWPTLSVSCKETAGHIGDVTHMTLMFCVNTDDALILRILGQAQVLHPREPGWDAAIAQFPTIAGSRQIFDLIIDLVQASCGTGIPIMDLRHQRGPTQLTPVCDEMGPDGVRDYWPHKTSVTIDRAPTGISSND